MTRLMTLVVASLVMLGSCSNDADDLEENPETTEAGEASPIETFMRRYVQTYDETADGNAYVTGCTIGGSEFSRLRETFGEWRVRHVYDEETLRHRFSDAKTSMRVGENDFRAQINRSPDGEFTFRFVYAFGRWEDIGLLGGWVNRIVVVIDQEPFEFTSSNVTTHEFIAHVDDRFLSLLATSRSPVAVQMYVDDTLRAVGRLPVEGSAAALRWLRFEADTNVASSRWTIARSPDLTGDRRLY